MEGILILGVAGSGKSTLTGSLSRWLSKEYEVTVRTMNMDPGAEVLPYSPDIDIRNYVSLRKLMREEGLGPNGALLRCMDLILEISEELVERIGSMDCDYVIVDTPGQMDLFALRPTGRRIAETISRTCPLVGVFLGDHELGREAEDAAFAAMMSRLVELKLAVPVIPTVNKSDLWGDIDARRIWSAVMSGDLTVEGVIGEVLRELIKAISSFFRPVRVVGISALKSAGFNNLMDLLKEVWCSCGDLT